MTCQKPPHHLRGRPLTQGGERRRERAAAQTRECVPSSSVWSTWSSYCTCSGVTQRADVETGVVRSQRMSEPFNGSGFSRVTESDPEMLSASRS